MKLRKKVNQSKQLHKIMLKNIKHDLINPINAMIGYSELILETLDGKKDTLLQKDIQCIYQSSSDILAILQNRLTENSNIGDDKITCSPIRIDDKYI